MNQVIPVIISGGSGARLWPVSREGHPKPFMRLGDGQTLLEKAYRRASKLSSVAEIGVSKTVITVTNRDYYFQSRDELKRAGANGTFLLEPVGRNTAAAIAIAAYKIREKFGPKAIMLVMSADHLILDDVAFSEAITKAVVLANEEHNFLVTLGILPSSPEVGFGYLKAGDKVGDGFSVAAYVEKPDLLTAKKYIESGNYFWNSGIFCFSAGQFLSQLTLHAPNINSASEKCWQSINEEARSDESYLELPEDLFSQIPNISIDYAIMEKSACVAVVPVDMGWSDVGSWSAVRDLISPDKQSNRATGHTIFINSNNTFVQSDSRLVAAVGLENVMIIDTPDALLVANPEHAQDVKQVVDILKKSNHEAFKLHKTVCRPWGTYTVLQDSAGFKIKRIEVRPGAKLSLQSHEHRSEHWIVVHGEAEVVNGSQKLCLKENESTYIPAGALHRLENNGNQTLTIIEVQCGLYLGEDDIVRYEDTYGRK